MELSVLMLPAVNALLNSISALFISIGYVMIRQRKVMAHRACMIAAFITSTFFLISYLIYHYYHGATSFSAQGIARIVYFSILISHTILAVVIVPLILLTFYRAFRDQVAKHQRIARWTLPLWLYVSVTGVIVYLMLYQIYPAN